MKITNYNRILMEKQKILHRRNSSKTKSKNCRKGQN